MADAGLLNLLLFLPVLGRVLVLVPSATRTRVR